jgi:hypothetical protein
MQILYKIKIVCVLMLTTIGTIDDWKKTKEEHCHSTGKKLIKCGIFIDLRMTHLNILLCHAYGSRFV